MKILLVNPIIPYKFKMFDYADEAGRAAIKRRVLVGPPLGLNELAAVVPDEDVIIIDQKAELDADPNFDFESHLIKELENFRPDIVGITCLTSQYNSVLKMLQIVKQFNNKILTTVGGIHPSSCPEDFAGSKADIISLALGKYSFHQIVKEFKQHGENADFTKIPSIVINNGTSLHYTKSYKEVSYKDFKENFLLDEVIPNRELTDRYDYKIPHLDKRVHYLSTSQGCTHKCNFCYLWEMTHGRYYYRDVESIISELKLMDRYPIIRFCDAHTFGDINKSKLLFNRIIEEGLNHHQFIADVRTDTVIKHPDLMELAVKAGLRVTICGLEATSDEELESYGKDNSIANIEEALKTLNQLGLYVSGNYIVRPDYDESDFERLARFVEDNPIYHSGFTILTPFPGTAQWEELKDEIVIRDLDYYNLTNAVTRTKLPEEAFYKQVSDLYAHSGRMTEKYFSMYGKYKLSGV